VDNIEPPKLFSVAIVLRWTSRLWIVAQHVGVEREPLLDRAQIGNALVEFADVERGRDHRRQRLRQTLRELRDAADGGQARQSGHAPHLAHEVEAVAHVADEGQPACSLPVCHRASSRGLVQRPADRRASGATF
jgi:hypothetical protein